MHVRSTGGTDRDLPRGATALIVMAKAPVAGRVKTRMCPPLQPDQAAVLAAAALLDTMDAVQRCAGQVSVAPVLMVAGDLSSAVGGSEIVGRTTRAASGDTRWRMIRQRGRTFGERLQHAHLAGGAGLATLQIGMDTPQVSADLLATSIRILQNADVDAVLGPAHDGGWWALGLPPGLPAAFLADVPMSTSTTGARTLLAMERSGLRVAILPTLTDVDTVADGRIVATEIPTSRFALAFGSMAPKRTTEGIRR